MWFKWRAYRTSWKCNNSFWIIIRNAENEHTQYDTRENAGPRRAEKLNAKKQKIQKDDKAGWNLMQSCICPLQSIKCNTQKMIAAHCEIVAWWRKKEDQMMGWRARQQVDASTYINKMEEGTVRRRA